MNSQTHEKLDELTGRGLLARELRRMEQERALWSSSLAMNAPLVQQMKGVIGTSFHAQKLFNEVKEMRSNSVSNEFDKLVGTSLNAASMFEQWQQVESAKNESMRRMLNPLHKIRDGLLEESSIKQMMRELSTASQLPSSYTDLVSPAHEFQKFDQAFWSVTRTATERTRKILDDLSIFGEVQAYIKDFERINKRWGVTADILGGIGSLKALHEKMGAFSLPVIDWGSAGALANLLGSEGIESQLSLLGIGPDGEPIEKQAQRDRGLFSRKQADALTLISLLLSILFFLYQERSSAESQAQTSRVLEQQTKQIESLNRLIEEALVRGAKQTQEKFVVRERAALVRNAPRHGAAIDGKLLPRELVQVIREQGKWIEVEYYHWLSEEYRTGWMLKKYLQRVPIKSIKRDKVEQVLLDQTLFNVSAKEFKAYQTLMDAPLRDNAAIQKLLAKPAPWEK